MHGLDTLVDLNARETINSIIKRARAAGVVMTREEVLEELKFHENEDTSQWSAVVDRLLSSP